MARSRSIGLALLLACGLLGGGCGDRYEMIAWWNEVRGDPYELDEISREIGDRAAAEDRGASVQRVERAECPDVSLTTYEGKKITYEEPVVVAEPFEDKLHELERIVVEVAQKHYGRAPRRLLHFGAFACRTVRGRQDRLSEHALGNAIDVSGFSFPRAGEDADSPADLPDRLRRPFTVSVRRHWAADEDDAVEGIHRLFLRELIRRLRSEDVFRGIIGPDRPNHEGHFHFDYSPWSYTRI